jgi:hypothetical protein
MQLFLERGGFLWSHAHRLQIVNRTICNVKVSRPHIAAGNSFLNRARPHDIVGVIFLAVAVHTRQTGIKAASAGGRRLFHQ